MNAWTGQDWAFLLGGIAVLISAVFTGAGSLITGIMTLRRVRDVGVKVDGMLVTRDKSNVDEGMRLGRAAGDEASAQRAEGRRQERDAHREAVALAPHPNGEPLPVADDRTAVAAERGAAANERIADAAETASEKKP